MNGNGEDVVWQPNAQVAGTAESAGELRRDHAQARLCRVAPESLTINVELVDFEHQQGDCTLIAARDPDISGQEANELLFRHEPGRGLRARSRTTGLTMTARSALHELRRYLG